jgi:hypothetical protein
MVVEVRTAALFDILEAAFTDGVRRLNPNHPNIPRNRGACDLPRPRRAGELPTIRASPKRLTGGVRSTARRGELPRGVLEGASRQRR